MIIAFPDVSPLAELLPAVTLTRILGDSHALPDCTCTLITFSGDGWISMRATDDLFVLLLLIPSRLGVNTDRKLRYTSFQGGLPC